MKFFFRIKIFIVCFMIFIYTINVYSEEIFYDDGICDYTVSPCGLKTKSSVAVAVLFTLPERKIKLNSIKVYIPKKGIFDTPFKIRILDVSDELFPGKDFIKNEILVNAANGDEWVTADISKYNLEINQRNIFVAVEWTVPPGENGFNAQYVGLSVRNPTTRNWMNITGNPKDWFRRWAPGTSYRKGNLMIRLVYQ